MRAHGTYVNAEIGRFVLSASMRRTSFQCGRTARMSTPKSDVSFCPQACAAIF